MIKAIIFDFDGVIVDTELKKFEDLKSLLKNTEFILKEKDFKYMIGKKTSAFLSRKFPKMNELEIKKITEQRRSLESYNHNLIPGIIELIKFIKSKKVKIALTTGSNKEQVDRVLKANKIKSYFNLIVSGKDFKESKPSPECYLNTLKKLKLKSSEVIVIEDSVAGIKSSKSANCKVFGIMTYFNKTELQEADKIFINHFGILEYFKKNS